MATDVDRPHLRPDREPSSTMPAVTANPRQARARRRAHEPDAASSPTPRPRGLRLAALIAAAHRRLAAARRRCAVSTRSTIAHR